MQWPLLRHGVLVVATLLITPFTCEAQVTARSPVVIVDVRDATPIFVSVSVDTLNDALGPELTPKPVETLLSTCRALDNPARLRETKQESDLQALALVEKLVGCVRCLKAYEQRRYFTEQNEDIVILVVYDASTLRFADILASPPVIIESPRRSELLSTAIAMARLIREAGDVGEPRPTCAAFPYTLRARRSHLKVQIPQALSGDGAGGSVDLNLADPPFQPTDPPFPVPRGDASQPPTGPLPLTLTSASPATQRATAGDGVPAESHVLVLGPTERWFFSVDLAVPSFAAELKWGKLPGADQKQIDANEFFVAINAAVGDLLADRDSVLQRRSLWQEIVFKFQMEVSRMPWNSWAVGLGLRGDRFKALLWNMDVVHPFVAVGRERVPETDEARWRVSAGFGFDPRSLTRGN